MWATSPPVLPGAPRSKGSSRPQFVWILILVALVVTGVVAWLSSRQTFDESFLAFDVCNGLNNQRIAVVSGMVLAKRLGRSVLLPRLIRDGKQAPKPGEYRDVLAAGNNSAPFGEMFDEPFFRAEMKRLGITVVDPSAVAGLSPRVVDTTSMWGQESALQGYWRHQYIKIGCPMFRVSGNVMDEEEDTVIGALGAMVPGPSKRPIVESAVALLREQGPGGRFDALHLRYESDWVEHCAQWTAINDGIARDNCGLVSAQDLIAHLRDTGVGEKRPVYVATEVEGLPASGRAVLKALRREFHVITRGELLADSGMPALSREEAALVDYYISLAAERFAGNSVSTFSALLILERQYRGLVTSWYNGGNIPVGAGPLPLYRTPWIFTYNNISTGAYDEMLKVSVYSAIHRGRVIPYCLFMGDPTPMSHWLQEQGVQVIYHNPAWADEVWAAVLSKQEENRKYSHLYLSRQGAVGTFQRIDIPTLAELRHHPFLLFTDSDTIFRRRVRMDEFGYPYPECIAMGKETNEDEPYFNAGVALFNMRCMRRTHKAFTQWLLAYGAKHGMHFPGYGPVDQGALNQFYEKQIARLDKRFNAKPYHPYNKDAVLIHFHGPKPRTYAEYANTGVCPLNFGHLCQLGMDNAAREYYRDWEGVVQQLPERGSPAVTVADAALAAAAEAEVHPSWPNSATSASDGASAGPAGALQAASREPSPSPLPPVQWHRRVLLPVPPPPQQPQQILPVAVVMQRAGGIALALLLLALGVKRRAHVRALYQRLRPYVLAGASHVRARWSSLLRVVSGGTSGGGGGRPQPPAEACGTEAPSPASSARRALASLQQSLSIRASSVSRH